MPKSRSRPEGVDVATAPPPAKRRKGVADTRSGGFEDVLLNKKESKKLAAAHTTKANGVGSARVNEQNVMVNTANGHGDVGASGARKRASDVVDISSDSSSSDDDEEEEEEAEAEAVQVNGQVNGAVNGVDAMDKALEEDAEAGAHDDAMEEDDDAEDDTFGARLQAQHAEPIDVEAELARVEDESSDETTRKPTKALAKIPTGATFSTVLTQALKTNDKDLLETCFATTDLESVRETLSRMDSRLVVSLMTSIAQRVSKTPGRLGNLMVWIQWAVIAHGGYLAGQPDIRKKLAALHRVIEERAQGLQPLLQLKGKLDMLAAQFDLRRDEQERNVRQQEDEEGAVTIYVEGEEDEEDEDGSSDSDDLDEVDERLLLNGMADDDSEDDEETVPAFAKGARNNIEASDSEESEGLFDEEASETDNEESDEEGDSEEDDSE